MEVCESLHRELMDWALNALNDDPQNPTVKILPGFPDRSWIKEPTEAQAAVVFVRSQTGIQYHLQSCQPASTGEKQAGEGNPTATYYNLGRGMFQAHILLVSKGEGANQKIDDMHGRFLLYMAQNRKFGTDDDYLIEDFKVTLIRPEIDPKVQKRVFRRDITLVVSGSIVLEKAEHIIEEIEPTTEVGESVEP